MTHHTTSNIEYIRNGLKCLGLDKMFFDYTAFSHESVILVLSPPACDAHTVAILSCAYCAIYVPSRRSALSAIHNTILGMVISCRGQCGA